MDLLHDRLKKIYPKFLFSALGGAIIMSIYSTVDAIMVGQYEGPVGAAAFAVVTPMYTIIFSLGLLFGIGGAVLMSVERGKGNLKEGNRYFTVALIACGVLTACVWLLLVLFDEPLLRFFGGEGDTLALAKKYFFFIKLGLPLFTMSQFLSCFVRNDNNPVLATAAVLAGGIWNMIGDYLLVFVADMGMRGAAIATITGQGLSLCVLLCHFFTKRKQLALVRPSGFFRSTGHIAYAGLASFAADFSAGVLCLLFNNRIMHYLGTDALAVYGALINIFFFVQSLSYGIGQAAQPIISTNFGAVQLSRVKKVLFASVISALMLGGAALIVTECFPVTIVRAFMDTTPQVEAIAPGILRVYCLAFIFLPFNVFALYYYQSVMRSSCAWIIAFVRGIFLSGAFVFLLPAVFGGNAVWWSLSLTEGIVTAINAFLVVTFSKIRAK